MRVTCQSLLHTGTTSERVKVASSVSPLCLCCFHVSDPEEEEVDALCQAGSSLAVVEFPRKRKGGEAEERSGSAVA